MSSDVLIQSIINENDNHRNIETCHYTYITAFKPTNEEVCEENFDKQCSITFTQKAFNETVRKCYRPVEKICDGNGPEVCQTVYESACTTKYTEKEPGGKLVGDTSCEKLPVEICGAGCSYEEGDEKCHDKTLATVVEVPEEICDLNPQKVIFGVSVYLQITKAGLRHQTLFLADMQIGDAPGAATRTHETVHHSSQGDLSTHILEVPCHNGVDDGDDNSFQGDR